MNKGLNILNVSAQDFGEVVKWIGCLSKALMFYILHSNKQHVQSIMKNIVWTG